MVNFYTDLPQLFTVIDVVYHLEWSHHIECSKVTIVEGVCGIQVKGGEGEGVKKLKLEKLESGKCVEKSKLGVSTSVHWVW